MCGQWTVLLSSVVAATDRWYMRQASESSAGAWVAGGKPGDRVPPGHQAFGHAQGEQFRATRPLYALFLFTFAESGGGKMAE